MNSKPVLTLIPGTESDSIEGEGRRGQIEQWLDDCRVDWAYNPAISISEIDVAESLHNQARLTALDPAKVDEYALAMDRVGGYDNFPAIVVYQRTKKWLVIDGNHRLNGGIRHGLKKIPAYVITGVSEEVVQVMTYEANIFNGLPTSQEERLLQAVHLSDLGMSIREIAKHLGLGESAVKGALEHNKADRRASSLGVTRGWQKLPKSTRQRLGSVLTDEGFVALATLSIEAGLTAGETGTLVTELNKSKSGKVQEELVAEAAKTFKARVKSKAVGIPTSRGFSDFNRLLGTLRTIEKYDPIGVAQTANLADMEPGQFTARCLEAAEKLMQLAEAAEAETKRRSL